MAKFLPKEQWFSIIAVGLIIAALGTAVYNFSDLRSVAKQPSGIHQGSLDLRADRSNTGWKLSWNPNSASLQHASKAKLLIEEGPRRTWQLLSPSQIRSGNFLYSPVTEEDVVFRLHAYDSNHEGTVETLRLVQTGRGIQPSGAEQRELVSKAAIKSYSEPGKSKLIEPRAPLPLCDTQPATTLEKEEGMCTSRLELPVQAEAPEKMTMHGLADIAIPISAPVALPKPAITSSKSKRRSAVVLHGFANIGRKIGQLFHRRARQTGQA